MKVFSIVALALFAAPAAAFAPTSTKASFTRESKSQLYKSKPPVFDEVCETTGVTLKRFMAEVAMLNPEISELTTLFGGIETACKAITNLVKRSQLPSSETLGLEGEVNIQGEDQKKLDVITNEVLKRALRFTGKIGVLASEEEDTPVSLFTLLVCMHAVTHLYFCICIAALALLLLENIYTLTCSSLSHSCVLHFYSIPLYCTMLYIAFYYVIHYYHKISWYFLTHFTG
jgi:hypothetical protein